MKLTYVTAALAALLATPAMAQTVPNGGFETPALGAGGYQYNPVAAGVTFVNHSGVNANGGPFAPVAPEGSQVGFIQNTDTVGAIIFQLSDLVAGNSYTASFSAAQRAGFFVNPLEVAFNGTSLGVFTPPSSAFTLFTTAAFTATGASGSLSFTGTGPLGNDYDATLDQVTLAAAPITPGAVPEPASWALMIVGFGAMGATIRRRARVHATALA